MGVRERGEQGTVLNTGDDSTLIPVILKDDKRFQKIDQCSERAETSVPKLGMNNHKALSRSYPFCVQCNSAFSSATLHALGTCSLRKKHDRASCNGNVRGSITVP